MVKQKLKISIIGAGSVMFGPATITDILLSAKLNSVPLEISLMDLSEDALQTSKKYADVIAAKVNRTPAITVTTSLEETLGGADFVITAIEVNRYFYWSQDFHIPRKYGSKQIYGENGGPGGMFHTLRNLEPMLQIAKAMERICPDAWLINYTNPEAKLVEAISKLTSIKTVGLCHGVDMGLDQLSAILEVPKEDLQVTACGLNHFGWFQSITDKRNGEDLYPLLRSRERDINWMAHWDEIALSRILFRTYGLYPYPGTNHIGEYLRWSDDFLASSKLQYFYDPVREQPWETGKIPKFIYSLSQGGNPTDVPLFGESKPSKAAVDPASIQADQLKPSREVGIPIMEAIAFDVRTELNTVNMPNRGKIPGLPDDMCVELPAIADGKGIHPVQMQPLPAPVTEMICVQGAIHRLVIEAYVEKSKNKLLQAILLDPTVSSYNQSVAMINEMCELQKDLLPPMHW